MKKLLALVLALVMTLSLCVTSNAAYADAADIDYKEAVDVMSAIGVLQGDGTNFNPDGILTRAEACTIIAKMFGMADYAGTTNFVDAKGHWGEGAIAFCAGEGIVNGVGGGKFDPNGKLIGYAFAKMLLVALGYDAKIEGMTGSDWTIGVAKLIKSNGLNDGIKSFVGSAEVSREVAAQMALNALQCAEVTYNQTESVTNKGEISVATNLKATKVDGTQPITGPDFYTELMEDYFPALKSVPVNNAQGEPATKWTNGAALVGVYANRTPVASYTTTLGTNQANLVAADLTGYTFNAATKLVTNGTVATAGGYSAATVSAQLAEGRLVEVYADRLGVVTDIVALDTYLATVTAKDTAQKKVTLTITVAGTPYTATLDGKVGSTNEKFYEEIYAMNKKDQILVNVDGVLAANFKLTAIVGAPKVVTGAVTATTTTPATFTIAGTAYKAASKLTNAATPNVGATVYNAVLDQYGNVISYSAATTATTTYAYVLNKTTEGNPMTGETYYVKLLFADGTTKWVNMTATDGETAAADVETAYTGLAAGDFVSYTADGDAYDLIEVAPGWVGNTTSGTLAKNMVTFDSKAMMNTTVVLVQNPDKTFTAYTGLANMPNTSAGSVTADYLLTGNASGVAKMIVVTASTSTTKDVIYVYDTTATGVKDVKGVTVNTYKALVNGELTTVDVKSTVNVTGKILTAPVYHADGYIDNATLAADTTWDLGSVGAKNLTTGVTAAKIYKITADGTSTLKCDAGVLTLDGTTDATAIVNADFDAFDLSTTTASYVDIDATGVAVADDAVIYVAVDANGYVTYVIIA